MLYELRIYDLVPGKVGEFLELIEKEGLPIFEQYLKLVGWWSTEVGPLNQVIHLWAYDDGGHRHRARASLNSDPRLTSLRTKILPLITRQTNMLLSPAKCSPLK